jgi:hypothetical protein
MIATSFEDEEMTILSEFLGLLGMVAVVVLAAWLLAVGGNKMECAAYAEATGRATKSLWTTCYVTADDGAIYTYEEHKKLLTAKAGLE